MCSIGPCAGPLAHQGVVVSGCAWASTLFRSSCSLVLGFPWWTLQSCSGCQGGAPVASIFTGGSAMTFPTFCNVIIRCSEHILT